jgi:hypothetical protein
MLFNDIFIKLSYAFIITTNVTIANSVTLNCVHIIMGVCRLFTIFDVLRYQNIFCININVNCMVLTRE